MRDNKKNEENEERRAPQTAEVLCNYLPQTSTRISCIRNKQSDTGTKPSKAISIPSTERFHSIRDKLEQFAGRSTPIFANEQERSAYRIRQEHRQQEMDYYNKYTYEVVLSFDRLSIGRDHAVTEMYKAMTRLHQRIYGRYRSTNVAQDFYPVFERLDKYKNLTHPHWHVLIHLPERDGRAELTTSLAEKCWKHGEVWLRDVDTDPIYDAYSYIHNYLKKDPNAFHPM